MPSATQSPSFLVLLPTQHLKPVLATTPQAAAVEDVVTPVLHGPAKPHIPETSGVAPKLELKHGFLKLGN